MAEAEAAAVEVEVSPTEETVTIEMKEVSAEDAKTEEIELDVKESAEAAEVDVKESAKAKKEEEETTTMEQDVVGENEEQVVDTGKKKRKRSKVEAAPAVEAHYSKRSRKSAENFQPENFATPKDTITIIEGRGKALKNIPNVKEKILSYNSNSDEIIAAHKLIFRANVGKAMNKCRQEHLLDFSGYLPATVEGEDKEERDKQDEKLETKMSQKAYKLVVRELKMLCDLFDIDRSPSSIDKDELIERLLNFLSAPDAKMTNANTSGSTKDKKKKGKKKKEEEANEEKTDDEEEEAGEGELPTDKALKQFVKAYLVCFNPDKVTVSHALQTACDKFGVDLEEKKVFIKKLLTELM